MPGPIRVTPVAGREEHRAFWTLPYALYQNTPNWPAPLRRDERRRWNRARNPALVGRDVWRFVAWRGRQPVGRVAAFYDPALAERWVPDTGAFGCFEAVDDVSVARALLAAAEAALESRRVCRVIGPVGLTFHDEMGLLVEGQQQPTSFLTPFNPPYYAALLEACGYSRSFEQYAYEWRRKEARLHPATLRAARRAAAVGVSVRPIRPNRWSTELRLLHRLYNESFQDVWGFVPITWDDFRKRADDFRPFYWPDLVLVAEQGCEPVGFALALPELSPWLARVRGHLWPFGAIQLALGARMARRARMMLLGVRSAWRVCGVAPALVAEIVSRCDLLGLAGGELSLVHEDNRAARRLIVACGGVPTKTFRVYHKQLLSGRSDYSIARLL
jgi:hypothetical protein